MHACAIPPRISRQRPKRPMSDIMGSSRERLGVADLWLRRVHGPVPWKRRAKALEGV